jgi:hypothetical protein
MSGMAAFPMARWVSPDLPSPCSGAWHHHGGELRGQPGHQLPARARSTGRRRASPRGRRDRALLAASIPTATPLQWPKAKIPSKASRNGSRIPARVLFALAASQATSDSVQTKLLPLMRQGCSRSSETCDAGCRLRGRAGSAPAMRVSGRRPGVDPAPGRLAGCGDRRDVPKDCRRWTT